jgi:hypothetical protein
VKREQLGRGDGAQLELEPGTQLGDVGEAARVLEFGEEPGEREGGSENQRGNGGARGS